LENKGRMMKNKKKEKGRADVQNFEEPMNKTSKLFLVCACNPRFVHTYKSVFFMAGDVLSSLYL
jgi:hypothetical protein